MSKVYKGYLGKVSKELSSFRHEDRDRILAELNTNLEDFITDHPNASYDDFIENFGEPDQYIESYIAFNSPEEIKHTIKNAGRKRRIIVISSIIIALTILFSAFYITWLQGHFATVIHTSDAEEIHVETGMAEEIEEIGDE